MRFFPFLFFVVFLLLLCVIYGSDVHISGRFLVVYGAVLACTDYEFLLLSLGLGRQNKETKQPEADTEVIYYKSTSSYSCANKGWEQHRTRPNAKSLSV
jgi:hypothetical protein